MDFRLSLSSYTGRALCRSLIGTLVLGLSKINLNKPDQENFRIFKEEMHDIQGISVILNRNIHQN